MVRFLLSNGNSTYSNGVFTFSLDRRLRNVTRARFRKASYVIDPSVSVVPNIVYLRSRALNAIAANTHTVILASNAHENAVDVFGILEDTHTTGRYRMIEDPRTVPLAYSHLRNLDFYFTDPDGNNLSFTETSEQAITAAEIAVRSDLFLFLNFTDSTKVTTTGSEPDVLLTEIEAVNDSTFEFIPNSGSGIAYEDFGSNGGKCAQFNNDWVRLNDASTTNEPLIGTFCVLFKTQPNTTDVQVICDWYLFRLYINAGGALSYYDGSVQETSISVENSTDYLLTVRRDNPGDVGAGTGFAWRLEKLSDNTVQSAVSFHGGNSPGSGLFDIAGNSSHSAAGMEISNMIVISSIADSDVSTIEKYLKQYYRGLETVEGGDALPGKFMLELDILASH